MRRDRVFRSGNWRCFGRRAILVRTTTSSSSIVVFFFVVLLSMHRPTDKTSSSPATLSSSYRFLALLR
uniref:Secreted peptide n=1 Tax=Acrobeloides nanus TaxID=290746 RepID=A0A914DY01_9BILA